MLTSHRRMLLLGGPLGDSSPDFSYAAVSSEPGRHEAACKLITTFYGFVTTTEEIGRIWDGVR